MHVGGASPAPALPPRAQAEPEPERTGGPGSPLPPRGSSSDPTPRPAARSPLNGVSCAGARPLGGWGGGSRVGPAPGAGGAPCLAVTQGAIPPGPCRAGHGAPPGYGPLRARPRAPDGAGGRPAARPAAHAAPRPSFARRRGGSPPSRAVICRCPQTAKGAVVAPPR